MTDASSTLVSERRSRRVAVALVATVIAACSASDSNSTRSNGVDNPADAAVGIVAEGCSLVAQFGSGVSVGKRGQVVTVAHTLRGASTITVVDASGNEHAATVHSFDKDTDLAVLDAPTLDVDVLALGDVATGAGSVMTWSPGTGVEVTTIEVSRRLDVTIEDIYNQGEYERGGLEILGAVRVGDSGGAVLNDERAVIGIVYARSKSRDDIGFATDATEVASVIAARRSEPVDNGRCV